MKRLRALAAPGLAGGFLSILVIGSTTASAARTGRPAASAAPSARISAGAGHSPYWWPGRLYGLAPLHWLSSPGSRPALQALQLQSSDAEALVRAQFQQQPEDLALYMAMLQASKSFREEEAQRQRARFLREPGDWRNQFRLGAALWMSWAGALPGPDKQNRKPAQEGMRLMKQAWERSRDPVVGLTFAECLENTTRTEERLGLTPEKVARDLIQHIAGPRAWRQYLAAERKKWKTQPPSAELVPVANRRALVPVLQANWSRAGSQVAMAVRKNGRLVTGPYEPLSPDRQAQKDYLERWLSRLEPTWSSRPRLK